MAQSARMISNRRVADVQRFYEILDALEETIGGKRRLAECDGRIDWPRRGVYFFFEPGEMRSASGRGPRVVRVGTHGLAGCSCQPKRGPPPSSSCCGECGQRAAAVAGSDMNPPRRTPTCARGASVDPVAPR